MIKINNRSSTLGLKNSNLTQNNLWKQKLNFNSNTSILNWNKKSPKHFFSSTSIKRNENDNNSSFSMHKFSNAMSRDFQQREKRAPEFLQQFNLMQPESGKTQVSHHESKFCTVNGVFLYGSVILLPNSALLWEAKTYEDITINSLGLFELLNPAPTILLLGTGDRAELLPAEIYEYFQDRQISIEAMSSFHAAATFNVLNLEDRPVAAAILSPEPVNAKEITPENRPGLFQGTPVDDDV
eukprot:gb/GECH01000146.1/.p1 GENE.gb/GECH01000146.1/~~gb/GECH01000146.1/.p1  ORF type:complete len:240 (+),score=69.95 gb/GECH01000146.1/:1-720(+)